MKFIFIILTLSSLAQAAIDLKPGLWGIEMKIIQGKNEVNPMAQVQMAMKNLPEPQKKQMMQMLKKQGIGLDGSKRIKQCLTKEMINKALIGGSQDDGCSAKLTKKSSTEYKTTYKCKNGQKGSGVFKLKDNKHYTANLTMKDESGKEHKMIQTARFISSNCGDIKPQKL